MLAPDESNMHLLEPENDERAEKGVAATARGRRDPLVLHDGRARTERRHRSAMLQTTARRDGGEIVIGSGGHTQPR